MFDHKHYVPILKGKEGEYGALAELPSRVKAKLTPLIEVPPIPWDYDNDKPSKSIDEHVKKACEKIEECWEVATPLFLDLLWIPDSERLSDSRHPLLYIFDYARPKNFHLIPVTGLRRDDVYKTAVKDIVKADNRGVCIRLENEDFEELELDKKLIELIDSIEVEPNQTDLILDFKEIPEGQTSAILVAARSIISALPRINEWRTLTFAGTGFPFNLRVSAASIGTIARTEWSVWGTLVEHRAKLPRLPTFGDYAIGHPDPFEVMELDPKLMKLSASLRYTTEADWLIVKGRILKKHGYEQYHDLCRTMLTRPEYKGSSYSWGDEYISGCAGRSTNPGNTTIWRKVGTNHHLTLVTEQIANFPGL